jgi:hypothetical protein
MAAQGDYLYVVEHGLRVFDVSDLTRPEQGAQIELAERSGPDLAIVDDWLYMVMD